MIELAQDAIASNTDELASALTTYYRALLSLSSE